MKISLHEFNPTNLGGYGRKISNLYDFLNDFPVGDGNRFAPKDNATTIGFFFRDFFQILEIFQQI